MGDLLRLNASINLVGKSSMEVGVRVEAENFVTGEVRHTSSAYLTYVSIDADGKAKGVPSIIFETVDDKRRNSEAKKRKEMRNIERERENLKK